MRGDRHRDLTNLIERARTEEALVKLERQVRVEIQREHSLQALIAKRVAQIKVQQKEKQNASNK